MESILYSKGNKGDIYLYHNGNQGDMIEYNKNLIF